MLAYLDIIIRHATERISVRCSRVEFAACCRPGRSGNLHDKSVTGTVPGQYPFRVVPGSTARSLFLRGRWSPRCLAESTFAQQPDGLVPRFPQLLHQRALRWDSGLGKPGAVEIATSGQWGAKLFGLTGGPGPNNNHAKIGVSTSDDQNHYVIFGDVNQQDAISGNCGSSQNGRGGLFFVIDD